MMDTQEKIAEMPITYWRGARILIRIELPKLHNSLSTQMVVDERELDLLRELKRPPYLDEFPEKSMFEIEKWTRRAREAERVVEMIAGRIANQICYAIEQEMNDKQD